MAPLSLSQRCLCVVSGASRGIGREFALQLAKKFSSGSHLILLARNEEQLRDLQKEVEEVTGNKVTVTVQGMDLHRPDEVQLKRLLSKDDVSFDLAICVHNVGTVGDIDKWAAGESDVQKWSEYFQINLFGVILLNNLFMAKTKHVPLRLIINVTSLCAIEPMKSLAYYCTGKSAREMFFRVLALENPTVTVLNYSPGMVDTEMAGELRTKSADEELRGYALGEYEGKKLLSPMQTTERMLKVVEEGRYTSGDHVDYHDE